MVALDSLRETERAQQRPKVFEPDVGIRHATEYLIRNPPSHTFIIAASPKPVKLFDRRDRGDRWPDHEVRKVSKPLEREVGNPEIGNGERRYRNLASSLASQKSSSEQRNLVRHIDAQRKRA